MREPTGAFSRIFSLTLSSTSRSSSLGHGLRVMEVEPQPVGRDERAGLLGVPAEHFAQRVVHQVRGGVVAADRGAARDVGARGQRVADADSAGERLCRRGGPCLRRAASRRPRTARRTFEQEPRVADLAAGLAVEARAVEDEHRLLGPRRLRRGVPGRPRCRGRRLRSRPSRTPRKRWPRRAPSAPRSGRRRRCRRRSSSPCARARAGAPSPTRTRPRRSSMPFVLEQRLRHVERQAVGVEQAEGFAAGQLLDAGARAVSR